MPNLLIPYALNSSGNIVHVDAVPRGKHCGCVCPACEAPLVARKGEVKVHHFAHANNRPACESALHATAKLMLFQRIQRAIEQADNLPLRYDCPVCECWHDVNLLGKAQAVHLETEIPEADIRHDILLSSADGKPLVLIEVVYKHSPEPPVLSFVKRKNVGLLEFVLEEASDLDLLEKTPLVPRRMTVTQCPCLSCSHCSERCCPHKGHKYCERCNHCVNLDKLFDYGLPEEHRDCPECGRHMVLGAGQFHFRRCFCCHIARKFKRRPCPEPDTDPDHGHCKKCGNRIKSEYRGVYELCYQCYQKERAEQMARREAEEQRRMTEEERRGVDLKKVGEEYLGKTRYEGCWICGDRIFEGASLICSSCSRKDETEQEEERWKTREEELKAWSDLSHELRDSHEQNPC